MHNPADEFSQSERRGIFWNDLKISTYRAHAEANADLELGGRYSKVTTVTVVGTSPIQYPRLPATAPSNQAALVGDERPLGFSVKDQEPVGEHFERGDAVGTPPSPAAVELDLVAPSDGDAGRAATSKGWRRL
jgi:hypothetical protein